MSKVAAAEFLDVYDTTDMFSKLLESPMSREVNAPAQIIRNKPLTIGKLARICMYRGDEIDTLGRTRCVAFKWMPGVKIFTHTSLQGRENPGALLQVQFTAASSTIESLPRSLQIVRSSEVMGDSFSANLDGSTLYQDVRLDSLSLGAQKGIADTLARHATGLILAPTKRISNQ